MEHWHTPGILPQHPEYGNSHNALSVASGNLQSFTLDSNDGLENQNPLPEESKANPVIKQEIQYSGAGSSHTANKDHHAALQRLHARQQRRDQRRKRIDPNRLYLQDPRYLDYRARQRHNAGPDGNLVWDDVLEDAFQNALVNIEPMGKRKKSQHSKPCGRNELISEWILQETGQYRSRKQVSSHIQVLKNLLHGIPEWDALIIASNDKNVENSSQNNNYYENSIEQMVRNQKSRKAQSRKPAEPSLPPPAFTLESNTGHSERHHLTGMSFEMWVSLPNQMDSALHTYTRLQSSHSNSDPSPLENLKNWRLSFPRLGAIIDTWHPTEKCDIILLETSFQPMTDFPPRCSKLGISIELDFNHPSSINTKFLRELSKWSCVTNVYQHGRLVKQAAYDDCHVSSVGKVKPFFESKWWASTFTHLTEKNKRAEDSKNEAAVQLAEESSRSFFRGLTIMQEVFATSSSHHSSQEIWTDEPPLPKRMAILLWKFSQALPTYVGTTAWQKLIPPPARITTNSPTPSEDMSLPLLNMDTVIDGVYDQLPFDNSHVTPVDPNNCAHYQGYLHAGEECCQDGFMMFRDDEMNGFNPIHSSMDIGPSSGNTMPHDLRGINHFYYGVLQQAGSNPIELPRDGNVGNVFDSEGLGTHFNHTEDVQMERDEQQGVDDYVHGQRSRHPLTAFDLNTHTLLQKHLQDTAIERGIAVDESLLVRAARVATLHGPDDEHSAHGQVAQRQYMSSGEPSWAAPVPTRPPSKPHYLVQLEALSDMYQSGEHDDHQAASNIQPFDANHLITALSTYDASNLHKNVPAHRSPSSLSSWSLIDVEQDRFKHTSPGQRDRPLGKVGVEDRNANWPTGVD